MAALCCRDENSDEVLRFVEEALPPMLGWVVIATLAWTAVVAFGANICGGPLAIPLAAADGLYLVRRSAALLSGRFSSGRTGDEEENAPSELKNLDKKT